MGDLSRNWSRHEFACKGEHCCGHSAPVHPDLVAGLQELRDKVGGPLTISSGFRCNVHNSNTPGAAPDSLHTFAMAADVFAPAGWTGQRLADVAEKVDVFRRGGIGTYSNRVHVDVRTTGPARWKA